MLGGVLIRAVLRALGLAVAAGLVFGLIAGEADLARVLETSGLAEAETQARVLADLVALAEVTVPLFAGSLLLALLLGLPLGIRIGKRAGRASGALLGLLLHLPLALPVFWLGLLALEMGWAQLAGGPGPFAGWRDPLDSAMRLAGPMLVLGLAFALRVARCMQWHVAEGISGGHIEMARAKGLSRRKAMARHGVGPAFGPMLTHLKRLVTGLAGAVLALEVVFDLPGVGPALLEAARTGDSLRLGTLALAVIAGTSLFHLLIELLRSWAAPNRRGLA